MGPRNQYDMLRQEDLTPVGSISPECETLKQEYDTCFNQWFVHSFLKGNHDMSACDSLLKLYTDCVKKAMKARNIPINDLDIDCPKFKQHKKK